jgi:hypothetical protein
VTLNNWLSDLQEELTKEERRREGSSSEDVP